MVHQIFQNTLLPLTKKYHSGQKMMAKESCYLCTVVLQFFTGFRKIVSGNNWISILQQIPGHWCAHVSQSDEAHGSLGGHGPGEIYTHNREKREKEIQGLYIIFSY